MINIIAIVVVLIIVGIIRGLIENRREAEEAPLNQRIRINEMRAMEAVNEMQASGSAYNVIENKMEEENKKEKSTDSMENNQPEEQPKENMEAKDFTEETLKMMQTILSELGCQPKKENEHELTVAYQGENFIVKTGGCYAQIWDPGWANISVNDPNFEKMKIAANISNFDFGPTILYTSPNEDGMVTLHSKREILLHPSLPDKNGYIKAVFDSFFEKKDSMRGQFQALITKQQQSSKPHRPVGFATSENEN